MVSMIRLMKIIYNVCDTLGPKALKETPSGIRGMNRKPIENKTDINHDDCFNNHERCLI